MEQFTAVILAAGEGSRMKSNTPKVLHKICGVAMLDHVVRAARLAGAEKIVVVVGQGADEIRQAFRDEDIEFVLQQEQKGTGHAVLQAKNAVCGSSRFVVLYGDMPLVTEKSIRDMVAFHQKQGADATVMTAKVDDPTGYGRIIKQGDRVLAIREEKDASTEERAISEINAGFYCFDTSLVLSALSKVGNDNQQGEYYLTDVVEILNQDNNKVMAYEIEDPQELNGVNNRKQLAIAQAILQKRIVEKHMNHGVTFINPDSSVVDVDVKIGQDTVIYPGVILEGNTEIGENCTIVGPSRIINTIVEDCVEINISQINDSTIETGVKIGPFTNIRPGCNIGPSVKVGDFVELKNTKVGKGTKVPHLSYVGDAVLGENINIGAGVIFVNYDGCKKHQTIVEDNAFIGCNSNLIAPVTVKAGSYVASGSTINREVPEDSLAIARNRQENKIGWVKKRRNKYEGGAS